MHLGRPGGRLGAHHTGRRVVLAVAVLGALATTACTAGQQAQTTHEQAAIDGTQAGVRNMALRGLAIAAPPNGIKYAKGSDAALTVVLSNRSTQSDKLVSITSSAFSGWAAFTDISDANAVQDAAAAASGSSPSAPATSAATGSTASGSGSGSGSQSVTIGSGLRVGYGTPEASGALLLKGFTGTVYPGSSISMTFTFANAGAVKVTVPVSITNSAYTSVLPGPSASAQNQVP